MQFHRLHFSMDPINFPCLNISLKLSTLNIQFTIEKKKSLFKEIFAQKIFHKRGIFFHFPSYRLVLGYL